MLGFGYVSVQFVEGPQSAQKLKNTEKKFKKFKISRKLIELVRYGCFLN
jgi:hypothetical protein